MQDLLILSPPRARHPDCDLSDLLDHCESVGEEVGEVLEQFEQRVVVVVPGDLSPGHMVTSDHPAMLPPPVVQRLEETAERGEEDDISGSQFLLLTHRSDKHQAQEGGTV